MPINLPNHLNLFWIKLEHLLNALDDMQNRLNPKRISEYIEKLKPISMEIKTYCDKLGTIDSFDSNSVEFMLLESAFQLILSYTKMESANQNPKEILKMFQALRPITRAKEILYPLANQFEEVSKYFLTKNRREDPIFKNKLDLVKETQDKTKIGIFHFENDRSQRGGYSLYVPEYYSEEKSWPLVVTLHGGSGHGLDLFWNWVREARSYGFIIASPTSRGRTWSIYNPMLDVVNLNQMLSSISGKWRINTDQILLTGISDGGTYSMLLSITHQSPFTHYAPIAAAVHVLINRLGEISAPVKGKKIYQVHGREDWMFPVEKEREVANQLEKAGANIVYREIADLSHNYPQDENENMLRWFYPKAFE
ncbi:MAG TPA: hypothetical protein PK079_01610 [Leptospiraceae bacterium]|nr:hypothetical protein [Leptospiraceae bacterium]HMW04789.1 hypothetical protein [Leptospiraceae bacterium]HMX32806.1 hypothetical protein [Leptospiraceae bacterium]HMY33543.1 hypothetical protein [Leptospiraceae bacterium]HMZ67567.1 hypothetical protein [Leptospiraceae bacterium]